MIFRFKQFSLVHGGDVFKVNSDSVLLGAWAGLTNARRILDIGAGNGLLALMAAQRNEHAHIDAVEVSEKACAQAAANFNRVPWRDRLEIHHGAIQEFRPDARYDYIISNPPYFLAGTPAKKQDMYRARHAIGLSYQDLAAAAARLLAPDGRFGLILPAPEMATFAHHARTAGLSLRRRLVMYPRAEKPAERILSEWGRSVGNEQTDALIMYGRDGSYTEGYRRLTSAFYPAF